MRSEHILVEFDALMDTSLAAVEVFLKEYGNSNYVKESARLANENGLKSILAFRKDSNPLSAILKSDISKEDMDSLYKEFIDKKYRDILLNTQASAMGIVASTIIRKMQEVRVTTYTTKPFQKELISHYDNQMNIVDYSDEVEMKERQDDTGRIEEYRTGIDLSDYTSLFMYNPMESLINYNLFKSKNIYVARLMFNLTEVLGIYVLKPEIMDIININKSKVSIMDYYRDLVPIGNIEDLKKSLNEKE